MTTIARSSAIIVKRPSNTDKRGSCKKKEKKKKNRDPSLPGRVIEQREIVNRFT